MDGSVSDLTICELEDFDVRYDTKFPNWDQVLLNNIKLRLKLRFVIS